MFDLTDPTTVNHLKMMQALQLYHIKNELERSSLRLKHEIGLLRALPADVELTHLVNLADDIESMGIELAAVVELLGANDLP